MVGVSRYVYLVQIFQGRIFKEVDGWWWLVVGRRVAQKNKNPITMQSSELPINDISEFISICALCLLQALSRCSCLNEYCM